MYWHVLFRCALTWPSTQAFGQRGLLLAQAAWALLDWHTHTLIVSPIVSPCVTDSEMQGVYLKSVRSPAVAGKFKMIYKQNHNMDIFSQVGLSGFLWCLLILGPVSQTGVSPCLRCTFNSESPLNMIFSLGLGCVWETVPSNKTLWFLSTVPFSLTKQNTN